MGAVIPARSNGHVFISRDALHVGRVLPEKHVPGSRQQFPLGSFALQPRALSAHTSRLPRPPSSGRRGLYFPAPSFLRPSRPRNLRQGLLPPRRAGGETWGGFRGARRSGGAGGGSGAEWTTRTGAPAAAAAELPPRLPPFRAGPPGRRRGFLRRCPRRLRPGPSLARAGRAGGGAPGGAGGAGGGGAGRRSEEPPARRGHRCLGYRGALRWRGGSRGRGRRSCAAGGAGRAPGGRTGGGGVAASSPRGRRSYFQPRAVPVAPCQGARVLQDSGNLPRPGT